MQALKDAWRLVKEEPFVAATGLAAFVHSTWTLAIVFSGEIPEVQTWQDGVAWLFVVLPACLIAFAVDVGQIMTSRDMRNGERNWRKVLTFAVLALATYYLQWFYLAHHTPLMQLGSGVRAEWASAVTLVRDASVWVIPALLPIATTLYTLSHVAQAQEKRKQATQKSALAPATTYERKHPARNNGALTGELADAVVVQEDGSAYAECPQCPWRKRYKNAKSARMAVTAHLRSHAVSDARAYSNGRKVASHA